MRKRKRLVIVGGGHAHLELLSRLKSIIQLGHEVVLINPSPFHYYSGMGPGLLSGFYRPEQVRFPVQAMACRHGARFIQDRLVGIDTATKQLSLASGEVLDYDAATVNIGSEVSMPKDRFDPAWCVPVKPIENLVEVRSRLLASVKESGHPVVVVGGGAAGVELAANLSFLRRTGGFVGDVILVSKSLLLGEFPPRGQQLARRYLQKSGVVIREGERVTQVEQGRAVLEGGELIDCCLTLLATGIHPPSLLAQAGLTTADDGGLLVNRQLQSVDDPNLFGGGDCVSMVGQSLARVGVYAVKQGPVLAHNILACLTDQPLQTFSPQQRFLQILNLGEGRGLLRWNGIVWQGRGPFLLKDFIDSRFMRRFQPANTPNNL